MSERPTSTLLAEAPWKWGKASLRLIASPGQHSDLRYATALASGIPACDAALDRGYVSAPLRAAFAAAGCTVHTPPKRGMVATMVQHHSHRPLPDLRRKAVRRLLW